MAGVVLPEPDGFRIPDPDIPGRHVYFDASEIKLHKEKLEPIYTADQLRQAIADALAKQFTQWQPIETAPKDGRWVITFDGEDVVPNYYLGSEIELWAKTPLLVNPTHWMPLPSAPDKTEAL